MKPKFMIPLMAATIILTAGCAKVPTAEIEAADAALGQASAAQAAEYAPEAMQAVTDARAKLDAELKAQEGANALFRDYDTATSLAAEVKSAAAAAETAAIDGRSRAREEAATLIAEVRTTLDEVKLMLAEAPKGKGTELDLAMLQSDVTQVEGSLTEMDGAFSEERYLESKAIAQSALDSASSVREHLQVAMKAKPSAVRG